MKHDRHMKFYTDDADYALWITKHETECFAQAEEEGSADTSDAAFKLFVIPVGTALSGGNAGKFRNSVLAQGPSACLSPGEVMDTDELEERIASSDCSYVMLPDVNVYLAPFTLRHYREIIAEQGGADLVYGDEDLLLQDGLRKSPYFKPEWSPDLLRSFNYFGAAVIYRRELLLSAVGNYAKEKISGAFLKKLNLRCAEMADRSRIFHVPEVVCHICGEEIFRRYYGIRPAAQEESVCARKRAPLVSIVIPSRDHFEYLENCVGAIISRTKWPNYEIIVVDNGSCRFEQIRIADFLERTGCAQYIYRPMEFNFSKMCNIGAETSKGEYLVLLNDDVIITQDDWIDRMIDSAQLSHVGAVGVKLLHPDGKIQHCGVGNMAEGPSHFLYLMEDDRTYQFGLNRVPSDVLAVTAACLMVKKSRYDEVGGMDESFAVTYNDVDFCLKLFEAGYFNVLRADVSLIHDESASRGRDILDEEKLKRLSVEQDRLYEKHGMVRGDDPFYSRNLSQWSADGTIFTDAPCTNPNFMERLPGTRRDLGLVIDRIDCGENVLLFGHIRGRRADRFRAGSADGGFNGGKTLQVYFKAGAARYLAADTTVLSNYRGGEDGVWFAAQMPQRYLTRSRSRIGVIIRAGLCTRYEEASPSDRNAYVEMRDYLLISRRNYTGGAGGWRAFRQAEETGDAICNFDELTFERGYLSVRGWAFLSGELHNDRFTVQIAVTDGDLLCVRDLARDERTDVAGAFDGTPNLLYSGFHRRTFLPVRLDPDRSEIWLLFTSLITGKARKFRCRKQSGD